MEASGKRYIVHGSRSDEFTIYDISDIHLLNRACDKKRLAQDVKHIADDSHAFWVGGGDNAEYISPTDKRFDPEAVDPDITVADLGSLGRATTDRVRDIFWPIRHKCLGLAFGNHEDTFIRSKGTIDLHAYLCTLLSVPNLRYSALFDVVFVRNPHVKKPRLIFAAPPEQKFTRETFRVFVHHGAGYAQTEGGKLNKLVQFMNRFEADIYMVGHVHDQIGKRIVEIGADAPCEHLVARERVGIIAGTYLRTYQQGMTTYGEKRGYQPVPLGCTFVKIRPETRQIKAEI